MFSTDYTTAREALYASAPLAGGRCFGLPLDARGPDGSPLFIDIAWFGAAAPRQVILHAAGLHGVEGFAGSAIQLAALGGGLPTLPTDAALILVHVLDPYGMAWLRRVNEAGVDLDHNVLPDGVAHAGTPGAYAAVSAALNPQTPPEAPLMGLRAGIFGLQFGGDALWGGIAAGQHDTPGALSWGGDALQQGPARLRDWASATLARVERLIAVDVRTGPGADQISVSPALSTAAPQAMPLGDRPGHYHTFFQRLLPGAQVDTVIQHFETVAPAKAAYALREENRWHRHGDGGIDHPTKAQLRSAFVRPQARWQRDVIADGRALLSQLAGALAG